MVVNPKLSVIPKGIPNLHISPTRFGSKFDASLVGAGAGVGAGGRREGSFIQQRSDNKEMIPTIIIQIKPAAITCEKASDVAAKFGRAR